MKLEYTLFKTCFGIHMSFYNIPKSLLTHKFTYLITLKHNWTIYGNLNINDENLAFS